MRLDGLIGVFGHDAARRMGDRVDRTWNADGARAIDQPSMIVRAAVEPRQVGTTSCLLVGDVYNRDALASTFHADEGDSSAAILARAYAASGERAIADARGAYVAVIWDHERRRGLLANDHLASRSLFFRATDGLLVFATEIDLLLGALAVRPEPDEAGVVQWMTTRMLTHRRTLFSGVERLGWGQLIRLADERWSRQAFWRPRYQGPAQRSRSEAAAGLLASLELAVGRRLAAPGRLGMLLSGGLDSGSVMAVAARLQGDGAALPSAYTLVMGDDPDNDETPYVDAMYERFGFATTRIRPIGPGALGASLAFLNRYEVPLLAPGYIMDAQLLRRAASDGMEIVMDGQGGDELFGVAHYLLADRLRHGRLFSALRLTGRMAGETSTQALRERLQLLRFYGVRGGLPTGTLDARRRKRGTEADAPSYFNARATKLLFDAEDPQRWRRESGVPLWWANAAHVLTDSREEIGLPDYLRRRAELEGMRPCSPLLDVDAVEFVLGCPPEFAFHGELDRFLARESLRGVLPDEIRLRRVKSNFGGFIQRTLAQDEIANIRRILTAPDAEIRRYVDTDSMGRALLDSPPGPWEPGWFSWGPAVWNLLTAETWLRRQENAGRSASLLEDLLLPRASHEVVARAPARVD